MSICLLWSYNLNLHFNRNRSSCFWSVKKVFLQISQNSWETKSKTKIDFAYKKHSWLTNLCEGVCLFKSWLVHGLLVLLLYDIKTFTKILLRLFWIKIVYYHCIQSIPWYPNLFLCGFYHPIIVWKKFFSSHYSFEVARQNFIWLDCFGFFDGETSKTVFNLKDQTKFWVSSQQNIGSNQAFY